MTRRDAWIPAVLTMVTCGFYLWYWQYVTTDELRRVSGREDLNPLMDLLLTFVCCGLFSIYVQYRNAQVVHELFARNGRPHEDKSTFVLVLHALALINGMTGLFAIMILQDEFNKVADAAGPAAYRF